MLTQQSLDFLKDLSKNNNREWFEANKKRYEKDLKKPVEEVIGKIIQEIQKIDPAVAITPKKAIFRIYRDIRFSKDKSPYKTHVGAVVSPGGTQLKEYPGIYIHVESGSLMIGGGAYFLETQPLYQLRQYIVHHIDEFNSLISEPNFKAKYGELKGEKNKKLPLEFQEVAEKQPLLYNKQFYFMAELDPKNAIREDFVDFVMEHYRASKPFNDFLIEALTRS
ncbi:MAG: DUF2461 domain-containing protein [Saprospiraceae bacterium]|nr:DUF2461 domain-containing protein [Saprospiraceae bacterium]